MIQIKMIRHATFVAFAILCIVNVSCRCFTSSYITASTVISPQTKQWGNSRCRISGRVFTSPPDTTMTISCPVFDVTCLSGNSNWLRVQKKKKICGWNFTPVTTRSNHLDVQYRLARTLWANSKFQCNVKVEYPQDLFSSTCNCHFKPTPPPVIVDGEEAETEVAPYHVSILRDKKHLCEGSLISDRWAVSSATCRIRTSYKVKLGIQSEDELVRGITQVVNHPEFEDKTFRFDIALVHLDEVVPLSSHIKPICLPFKIATSSLVGKTGITTGWVIKKKNYASDKALQNLQHEILSIEECAKVYGNVVYNETICTKILEKDVCNYDAGGPLSYTDKYGTYLVGVSLGNRECDSGARLPSVYTRVANTAILQWIRTITNFECLQPPPAPLELDQSVCEICGTRKSGFHTRIVGGQDAKPGEFPYQVSITEYGSHFCGGSLLTKDWVVSAAHCEIHPKRHTIILGEHNQKQRSGEEIKASIETVINHANYNVFTMQYDIALVKLAEEVEFTDFIRPICLPDYFKPEDFYEKFAEVSGWGVLDYDDFDTPNILQQTTLEVIPSKQCKKVYGNELFEENICTHTLGKDACQGDSGGPLGYQYEGRFFLIGVTSWGIGCALRKYPGVYTSMAHPNILKWVKKNTGIECMSPQTAVESLSSPSGHFSSKPSTTTTTTTTTITTTTHPSTTTTTTTSATTTTPTTTTTATTTTTTTTTTPTTTTTIPMTITTTTTATSSTTMPPKCKCGKTKRGLFNRIVGGDIAGKGEFPFQVSLNFKGLSFCGGSLISDQFVVTAAHCDVKVDKDYVILGEHDLEVEDNDEIFMRVESFLPHPSYNNVTTRFDIALLKLARPVTFTDYIQPICLPDSFTPEDFVDKTAEVTGWGALEYESDAATKLNKVTLDVISYEDCKDVFKDYLHEENMCTATAGKDACQGDSGGPLSYLHDSKRYLIGVVSWGIGCAHPDYPGVYTSMTDPDILSWVKTNSGIECAAP